MSSHPLKLVNPGFKTGYTPLTRMNDFPWTDPRNTLMDFGILRLEANQKYQFTENLEKSILLMTGQVVIKWITAGDSAKSGQAEMGRRSLFDESPWCVHVPAITHVEIECIGVHGAELAIGQTTNPKIFHPKLYSPKEVANEQRGAGAMRETSTRQVRTISDIKINPDANLVLGEVITYPGKWSSYPPHHHPQPEIYHYRFLPANGFGFAMLGEDVVKVKDGDSTLILNDVSHPQTAAPGYAMYYIWIIRHLDGNPYGIGTPIFEPEHLWVQQPENQKKIWPPE